MIQYTKEDKQKALQSKIEIEGNLYFSKQDFSIIINKFPCYISKLAHHGNKFRKLKSMKIGNSLFILASEVTDFPHCPSGKAGQGDHVIPYYYDIQGKIIPTTI